MIIPREQLPPSPVRMIEARLPSSAAGCRRRVGGRGQAEQSNRRLTGHAAQKRDNCNEDVDSAVNSMTSLLELLLIVFLAIVVDSIVTARFRPLHAFISHPGFAGSEETDR